MIMIDEEWLAETLRDLGSAIEVPSDGPARVLAARGAASGRVGNGAAGPGRRFGSAGRRPSGPGPNRHRQRAVVGVTLSIVAVLVIGLVLTRQGAGPSATTSNPSIGGLPPISRAGAGASAFGTAKSAAPDQEGTTDVPAAPASSAASAAGAAPATGPATAPLVGTKVIKTGTVDLRVGRGKLSPAVDQLTSLAGGLGGYVADATTNEVGPGPTADLIVRVPVAQFETLLTRARALGTPTTVTTSGQDVTAAYVDLNAQIQALEDTRAQYLQIMAKATTIGDILSVEQQLSDLQSQLDQLQGQQMVLADQTSFGTLTVQLSESGSSLVPASPHGFAKAWDHARSSFADGVEAVIGASGGILVFLVCAGLLLLAGRLVWPAIRRRLV